MPTKAAQLYALLFDGPSEVFPPGLSSKKDVYRVWMHFRQQNGGHVSKADYKILMPKLAKQVEAHYKCLQNSEDLANLNTIKTNVARIIRSGDYLNNSGGRINDENFVQEQKEFFSEILHFQKSSKKEPVASIEVLF